MRVKFNECNLVTEIIVTVIIVTVIIVTVVIVTYFRRKKNYALTTDKMFKGQYLAILDMFMIKI